MTEKTGSANHSVSPERRRPDRSHGVRTPPSRRPLKPPIPGNQTRVLDPKLALPTPVNAQLGSAKLLGGAGNIALGGLLNIFMDEGRTSNFLHSSNDFTKLHAFYDANLYGATVDLVNLPAGLLGLLARAAEGTSNLAKAAPGNFLMNKISSGSQATADQLSLWSSNLYYFSQPLTDGISSDIEKSFPLSAQENQENIRLDLPKRLREYKVEMYQCTSRAKRIREIMKSGQDNALKNNGKALEEAIKQIGNETILQSTKPRQEIKTIQTFLKETGAYKGRINRVLDSTTISALSKYLGENIHHVNARTFKKLLNPDYLINFVWGQDGNIKNYERAFVLYAALMGNEQIKQGGRREEIEFIQMMLADAGAYKGPIDSVLNQTTLSALSEYFGRNISSVNAGTFIEMKDPKYLVSYLERRAAALKTQYIPPLEKEIKKMEAQQRETHPPIPLPLL